MKEEDDEAKLPFGLAWDDSGFHFDISDDDECNSDADAKGKEDDDDEGCDAEHNADDQDSEACASEYDMDVAGEAANVPVPDPQPPAAEFEEQVPDTPIFIEGLEKAKTGRSKCMLCGQLIPVNSIRQIYHTGKAVSIRFLHPQCMPPQMDVDSVARSRIHLEAITDPELSETAKVIVASYLT